MPTHLHPGRAGACTWDTVFLPRGCGRRGTLVTNCTSACGLFAQRRRWLGLGDKPGAACISHIQPAKHRGPVAFPPPTHKQAGEGGWGPGTVSRGARVEAAGEAIAGEELAQCMTCGSVPM